MLQQLLFASGFLFMGATEEQMALTAGVGIDAVAYVLILYSLAFLLFLFVMMLINVYDRAANPVSAGKTTTAMSRPNGHAVVGSHHRTEEGRLRDAGEFELEGLMTDEEEDEDEEEASKRKLLNRHGNGNGEAGLGLGLASPSATLGRNNDRLA